MHNIVENSEELVGLSPNVDQPHCLWMLDDDMKLCRMVETYFKRQGWTFRSFYDTSDFEIALLESSPEAAIVDLMLPGKNVCVQGAGRPVAGLHP